jgi:acyl carrier protein
MEPLKNPENISLSPIDIIREYIIDQFLYGEEDGFDESSPLLDGGLIDSTGVLELIAFIESTFHIQFEDRELVPENFSSLTSMGSILQVKGIG